MKIKGLLIKLLIMMVLGSLITAYGCGDEPKRGVSEPVSETKLISIIKGVVSDDPINGARVFIDINYNGAYDEGEPFSITNEKGEYTIEYILDQGTDYLLIAEGSETLGTNMNGAGLNFVMFSKISSSGSPDPDPDPDPENEYVSECITQHLTPVTFKEYLREINTMVGGIDDQIDQEGLIKNIIESKEDAQVLFENHIKDKQASLMIFAQQLAEVIKYTNSQKDALTTIADITTSSGVSITMADQAETIINSNPLLNKLMTNINSIAIIGEVVISKPMAKATTADVVLTNMIEIFPKITFTVKPSLLTTPDLSSVTPYASVLEIPKYSEEIRSEGDGAVLLGGDIKAKIHGVRDYKELLGYVAVSSLGDFTNLQYFYYNGTQWVDGGNLKAEGMAFYSAPFVIIKRGSTIDKTVIVDGLNCLIDPVVIVKAYDQETKKEVIVDVLVVKGSSNNIIVQVPINFLISKLVVIDSELKNITSDEKPSISILVTDTLGADIVSASMSNTTTTIFITDETLLLTLRDGSTQEDFPGLGSFIDTKIIFRGIDMLAQMPSGPQRSQIEEKIEKSLVYGEPSNTETATDKSDGFIKWQFERNKVVRTYEKPSTQGDKDDPAYSSAYTFFCSTDNNRLINVLFEESISEWTNDTQTLSASYEGTAFFDRETLELMGARFYQKLSKTKVLTKKVDSANGMVEIDGSTLSFDGQYVFNITSYGEVEGSVTLKDAETHQGKAEDEYFNNNTIPASGKAIFSSKTAYNTIPPSINQENLIGIWSGTFTDNCGDTNGHLSMSITKTTATWWGLSADNSRFYGTVVAIKGDTLILKNEDMEWATVTTVKISDTSIVGNWSDNNCQGSFILNKTP